MLLKKTFLAFSIALVVGSVSCEDVNRTTLPTDEVRDKTEKPEQDLPLGERDAEVIGLKTACFEVGSNLTKRSVLKRVACETVYPSTLDFYEEVVQFAGQLENECLNTKPVNLANLREAFEVLMTKWQRLEVMQWGPLAENSSAARELIYSWPSSSSCAIDKELASILHRGMFEGLPRQSNRTGLDALDYLFYRDTLSHSCRRADREGLLEAWNAAPKTDRVSISCEYANAAVDSVKSAAYNLVASWGKDKFSLVETIEGPASKSRNLSFQDLSDALYYFDMKVKDSKLASPAGQVFGRNEQRCRRNCENKVERFRARKSVEAIRANFDGFKSVIYGNSGGYSVDDLLNEVSADTSELLKEKVEEVDSAISEIEGSTTLYDLAKENGRSVCGSSNKEGICGLWLKVKALTDVYKSEFLKALDLKNQLRLMVITTEGSIKLRY